MQGRLIVPLVLLVGAAPGLVQCTGRPQARSAPAPVREGVDVVRERTHALGLEEDAPVGRPAARPDPCVPAAPGAAGTSGKEVLYAFLDEGERASADLILRDAWPVPRFAPVELPEPLTWTENPYDEKYWRFLFYSLRPTAHLLHAFRETGDARYRDKLLSVIASFAARGQQSPYAEDKHTAAFRAMVLVNTWGKLSRAGALSPQEAQLLETLILASGRFLEDPRHFDDDYNHGLTEASALLLIAENFPAWAQAPTWRALALQRLEHLLGNAVAADGVANENSVYYHFYILTHLWQLADWAQVHGVALSPRLSATLEGMFRFGTYIVQPDGFIPMLGASLARQVRSYEPELYRRAAEARPTFRYVLSAGRCGSEPTERLARFPDSGLAILRSGFGPAEAYEAQTHLVFDAGPYRTTHSDLDALSLHLASAGRTLLTDPGLFTYEPGPERSYFHGTRAHNTVTVDGADQQVGGAQLGPSVEGLGWLYQSGWHALYPGVTHWRGALLLGRDAVLVLDELQGADEHTYAQRWHLPPDLDVDVQGVTATVTDAQGAPVLRVHQAPTAGLGVDTVRGATSPLDGWYSAQYEQREPAAVLQYQQQGTAVRFVTLFTFGPLVGAPARASATAVGGALEAEVCAGGLHARVHVTAAATPGERVEVVWLPAPCAPGG